ncbi:acyl-CoA dehydrogenase family protein [Alicyclobacillus tolerans]|uniref:Alkylation response protein AidB-like acyl-CoA dehydrogenase n=2 Tax=Alicyclobacillus tolerans TaxID=90970 RepID=A0ABT9LTE7_9BACL|nr:MULTISPECIES: acyl-CoA dehydrogenase family protein [Alicyclobacillus]MDP9727540.1 alkylation response protein AidB-like acyl-CoA dehydrogenase [Alicyclobacillus tengchongensis]SHJ67557.1 Acyl-CoA dehydrogenase [Alicyclobacillus montanus]
MATEEKLAKGAAFLIEETQAEKIFTPEDFTQEHQMIAETTRSFVEGEILPHSEQLEHQDWDLTVKLLHKAGELGLLAADIPEEYEGLGADKVTSALITEEITRGGSFALSHGAHVGIGTLPIVFFGNEDQKRRYLPKLASGEWIAAYALTEPGSGSDALGAKTTATLSADGKHYVLNGTKQYITNSGFANVFVVYAKIDGEKFSAFIVERDYSGVSTGPEEKKMGIKASSTRQLILEDVHVPVENLLGEPGRGHVIAFNILNIGRHKLAVGAVGAMKSALQVSVKYAKERKQFGTSISSFPLIQQKLADMNILTFVTESMAYRTTGDIDRQLEKLGKTSDGRQIAQAIEEYALECSVNKVFASEALDKVVDEGVQIHGGAGFIQDYPIERMYRDSRINRIFEGTNEVNRMIIPNTLLRKAMKGELALLQAATALQSELMGMMPISDEVSELGPIQHQLAMMKKIFLFVGGVSVQKYMQSLKDEQEILAWLADIVIEIYATESALLRTQKELDKGASAEQKVDMTTIFAQESFARVEQSARNILASMEEGDMLRTQLTLLRKLTRVQPVNTRDIKRRIAQRVIDAEKYLA